MPERVISNAIESEYVFDGRIHIKVSYSNNTTTHFIALHLGHIGCLLSLLPNHHCLLAWLF